MAKPGRMKEIEQEYHETRETLLPRILNECGSVEAAAKQLRISVRVLYGYYAELGIQRKVTYAAVEREDVG